MSRARTAEEVRDELIERIQDLAQYWASLPDKSIEEKCDGLAFSILCIFDGTSVALPAFNISCCNPDPADKAYYQDQGENWYEDGMVINDCTLHELYVRKVRRE